MRRHPKGFTLIELLITIAVLAVLIALAAPSFTDTLQRRRIIGAAEAVTSTLQLARSEAIRQSASMTTVTATGASWCVGFARGITCDCTLALGNANACSTLGDGTSAVLRVVAASGYSGVTMTAGAPAAVTFDGVRGTATGETDTAIALRLGSKELRVSVNPLGRISMCSPSGSTLVAGYPTC